MALVVVLTHEFDAFGYRAGFRRRYRSFYMLFNVLQALEGFGHSWRIVRGTKPVAADACILHVNATRVPDAYLALARHYRVPLNFKAADISKRRVSGASLAAGDPWAGPVIIKSDLNYFGKPEALHNQVAQRRRQPLPYPGLIPLDRYRILGSVGEVAPEIWGDANLVVERFIPEPDPQGYALRTWVFMGARERCTRHVSRDPIVKAGDFVARTPVEVPVELRAERRRLGFDYGKFDFVVHDGQATLLDANRTPSTAPALDRFLKEGARNLAIGLDEMLSGASDQEADQGSACQRDRAP